MRPAVTGAVGSPVPAAVASERKHFADAVMENPTSADAWCVVVKRTSSSMHTDMTRQNCQRAGTCKLLQPGVCMTWFAFAAHNNAADRSPRPAILCAACYKHTVKVPCNTFPTRRWHFLQHEDTLLLSKSHGGEGRASDPGGAGASSASAGAGSGAGSVSLFHLFRRATELVQRTKGRPSEAYIQIWLGYAKHQW